MKRANLFLSALAALAICGPAFAQKAAEKPAEGASGSAAPKAERTLQIHTEIRLFLANGDKISGIVKNNRFCEKPNGKDFVAASPEEKGSGLRLFFIHDTKSYVFFPKEKYLKYERVRGLTEVEFRDLARTVEESLRKKDATEDLAKKEAEKKDEKESKAGEKKPTAEEQDALAKKQAQEADWLALLERFSPEVGWGEEYFQKIKQSRINGIYPNSEEAEFERKYETWKKASRWAEEERRKQQEEEERKAKKAAAASGQ